MNILAISGSLRKESYNTALLREATRIAPEGLQISLFKDLESIPPFNAGINEVEFSESVVSLRDQLNSSDGVIISTPEYAHGVPGAIKNALNWVADAGELVLKPVAVMNVSTSGLGGVRSSAPLILTLSAMNWNVVIEACINIPYARNRFNSDLGLSDSITKERIKYSLLALGRAFHESV